MKTIFLSILCTMTGVWVSGQYLPAAFHNKTVVIKNVANGKYISGHDVDAAGNSIYQLDGLTEFYSQDFYIEPVEGEPTYFALYHVISNRYVTNSGANRDLTLAAKKVGDEFRVYQTFQFIAQTQAARFKIHSRWQTAGTSYIIEVPEGNNSDGARLRLGANRITQNVDYQRFDLVLLDPPTNPGSAIPSLADRFEGRTVGLYSLFPGKFIKGNSTTEMLNGVNLFNDFNKEFRLDYTNETGWYKIYHKPTGKLVTITQPIDGGEVRLKLDADYDDDRQKFKFVIQNNDSTYKIHSKYSIGPSATAKALVLEVLPFDANVPMRLKANITLGQDAWQKFILFKYINPPAKFTKGSETKGDGKILGKQYYISNFESLALLEPYIVGNDTLLRIQPNPVYGEQAEWTIDDGVDSAGFKHYRLRYGKTGQYLYVPTANAETKPAVGTHLQLKADTGTVTDMRYQFRFDRDGTLEHTFALVSGIAPNTNSEFRDVLINDDGYLVSDKNTLKLYRKNRRYFINLSIPMDSTKMYSIVVKKNGNFVSDSGVVKNTTPVVQLSGSDYSCYWKFIPLGNDQFYIKSVLTGQYLSSSNLFNSGPVVAASSVTAPNTRWKILVEGNYYKIQNVSTGYFLATNALENPGSRLVQTFSAGLGNLWVISRSDYAPDLLFEGVASGDLLSPLNIKLVNATTSPDYANKMMQTIGLPFEPAEYKNLYTPPGLEVVGAPSVNNDLTANGFDTANLPRFLPVLRSALMFSFGYTGSTADQALSNYKLDSNGHRVALAYALKRYIVENLALRDRSSWTFNELELVKWLENVKIRSIRGNYADGIEKSWYDFKVKSLYGGEMKFDILLGPDLDYTKWTEPDYYIPTSEQCASLLEYSAIARGRAYSNPALNLSLPGIFIAGGSIGTSLLMNNIAVPAATAARSIAFANEAAARAACRLVGKFAEQSARTLANVQFSAAQAASASSNASLRMLQSLSSIQGAAVVVSVIQIASQLLITRVVDGVKFEYFEDQLLAKIGRLRNTNIDINAIMQGNNLMNRFYLWQDLDYILGSGKRFTDPRGDTTITGAPIIRAELVFTGSGNWNVAQNWRNGNVPLSIVPGGTVITIDPASNGECLLNIPIMVENGAKIIVKPGKTIRVQGNLTVPGITKQ